MEAMGGVDHPQAVPPQLPAGQPDEGRGVRGVGVDDIVVVLRQELFQDFIGNRVVLAEGGAGEGDVVGEASQGSHPFGKRFIQITGQLHCVSGFLQHTDMGRKETHSNRHRAYIQDLHCFPTSLLRHFPGRDTDICPRFQDISTDHSARANQAILRNRAVVPYRAADANPALCADPHTSG